MENNKKLLAQIRQAVGSTVDTVSRNSKGQIVLRRGFYYRHGMDCAQLAEQVTAALATAGIDLKVVDRGEVWKPFRGGSTVAQGSHWYVVLA